MKKRRNVRVWLLPAVLLAVWVPGCGGGTPAEGTRGAAAEAVEGAQALTHRAQTTEEAVMEMSRMMNIELPETEGPEEFRFEEYIPIPGNPFLAVKDEPLSTFSADVDTASYANPRCTVLLGQEVPADTARIEELLNYFHDDYPQPGEGQPFSVTTRIGVCPWNEERRLLQIRLQAGKPENTVSAVTDTSGDQAGADGVSGTAIENLQAGGSRRIIPVTDGGLNGGAAGNGHDAGLDSISGARKEPGGTLFTVAKDVQVEFNPAKVRGYRLVSYENRRMEAGEFDDAAGDGGAAGAGNRVTALYELEPAGSETSGQWLNLKIRYKEPDGTHSSFLEYPVDDSAFCRELQEDMQYTACEAETGTICLSHLIIGP